MNAESSIDAPVAHDSERADELITRVSPDVIVENIKANLEPLNEQISTLTQLLIQLIHENLARNSPTKGPRTQRTKNTLILWWCWNL